MNPELRRNLWLEFSLHRLIGMPAVLALLFALFGSFGGAWRERVFTAALWGFVILAHFWGTRQASAAVTDEVRDRTWDWQRLSALSPWQMTWGKRGNVERGSCCNHPERSPAAGKSFPN